jgi:hypothetical protein
MTEYNSKAQLELIDKQAELLRMMSTPVVMVTEKNLRDEFAMAALPALISDPDSVAYPIGHAKLAYEYADAMMEARK